MKIGLLLLISSLSSTLLWGAQDFKIQVDGVEDEILVSLPKNYDSTQSWPAVFYYPGTGGRPQTSLMRSHTGEDDWIVVGMGYAMPGTFQLTPESMDAEVAVLTQVTKELEKRAHLDPKRIYASGFSKGGWFTGLLLQEVPSLAGGAILGAGHQHQLQAQPKALRPGTPVFIGVGRNDGNYPFGLKALLFFRKLGAQVTMETWRGLGHSFPQEGSPGLKEWLALQLGQEPNEAALEKELAGILASKSGFERWWQLIEFADRPAVKAVPEWEAQVKKARLEAEGDATIAREARMLKESRRLLSQEIAPKTLEGLEAIVAGYARLAEAGKESPQGEVATKDYERASLILDAARKEFGEPRPQETKKEAIEVKPDSGRRRIPGNPLVR